MKGLILKDLYVILKQMKVLLLIVGCFDYAGLHLRSPFASLLRQLPITTML